MPGYAFAMSPCLFCKQVFSYNPNIVPSYRKHGVREPICQTCMDQVNQLRKEKGLDPLKIAKNAYEPCPEEDLRR